MALVTGKRFGGYEIESLIGVGGMGEVYRARDIHLNRDVAVKVLLNLSTDAGRLRRFEEEARAAGALNHPNILAVYHMGLYDGAPYLVTELLEGETLRQIMKKGLIPLRKVIDYAVQLANGLEAAHQRGIVHRDLKPENVFVTREGSVKILDFGLAKLTQPLEPSEYGTTTVTSGTEPGVVMGTAGYMSPEQVRGERTDNRTDIFSFGAMLYEMLSNHRAFKKATATETMTATLREEPLSLIEIAPNVPPILQRIVSRCLEKEPAQRFHSSADLAFALESVADDTTTAHRTVAIPASSVKANSLVLVGAIVLVLGAAVLLWERSHPRIENLQPVGRQATAAASTRGPKEITIQDPGRFEWFASGSNAPRVWYALLPDGTFRYFDGPGSTPDGNQQLLPITPEFVASHYLKQPKNAGTQEITAQTLSPPLQATNASRGSASVKRAKQQELEAMTDRAQSALDEEDYRTAVDSCTQVLALSPQNQRCTAIRQHASVKLADLYVEEGMKHWEKGDFQRALHQADRALEIDPANRTATQLKKLATEMKRQRESN